MQSPETAKTIVQKYRLPEHYLLYVGSINARKNLLNIVKSLKLLPKDIQIPLVVVGNGHQYKKEVLNYIQKAQLTDNVIFINNLHDPLELQAFYQEAEIFIYPSYYEGFGLPVTEAGGPDSFYIDPDSPEEIAKAIETILSDTKKKEQMIENGYLFANQQFDTFKLTKQVHQLYHKIYAGHE